MAGQRGLLRQCGRSAGGPVCGNDRRTVPEGGDRQQFLRYPRRLCDAAGDQAAV